MGKERTDAIQYMRANKRHPTRVAKYLKRLEHKQSQDFYSRMRNRTVQEQNHALRQRASRPIKRRASRGPTRLKSIFPPGMKSELDGSETEGTDWGHIVCVSIGVMASM